MTLLWKGMGLLLCGLAAVLVLRETRKEFTPYIILGIGILTYISILPVFRETADWLNRMGTAQPYLETLLKALGISLLTEIGCDISKSAGETGIAGYAAMIGKAEMFLLTFPVFQQLISLAAGLPE